MSDNDFLEEFEQLAIHLCTVALGLNTTMQKFRDLIAVVYGIDSELLKKTEQEWKH